VAGKAAAGKAAGGKAAAGKKRKQHNSRYSCCLVANQPHSTLHNPTAAHLRALCPRSSDEDEEDEGDGEDEDEGEGEEDNDVDEDDGKAEDEDEGDEDEDEDDDEDTDDPLRKRVVVVGEKLPELFEPSCTLTPKNGVNKTVYIPKNFFTDEELGLGHEKIQGCAGLRTLLTTVSCLAH
jgi:hypothetical protein